MMSVPKTLFTTGSTTVFVPAGTRLRLKPHVASAGYVDGAWWPRSRSLRAELPELLEALRPRLGRIERLAYNLSDWELTARKAVVGSELVRLDGFFSQAPDLVTVVGAVGRTRMTLLVVPPETADVIARRVLLTAARPDNTDGPDVLLAARTTTDTATDGPDVAAERWEGEGGRRYEHA